MCISQETMSPNDVSIGAMSKPESYEEKCDRLNDCDRAYGTMCLAIPPTMRYLLDFPEYLFELWRNLDEDLGMNKEDVSYMESKQMSTSLCVLPPMISASCISQEVVQNEEEEVAIDSTNDPAQVSSSMALSPCQEAMFHEERIRVASITTAEDLSIHSTPFSSMSSVMNGE